MQSLTVFYDPACGLCTRVKHWLERQPAYVPLTLVPMESPLARRVCPALEQLRERDELVVVSDSGGVYLGNHAWIVCLWALRGYRRLAERLASPMLLPLARQAFEVISDNRASISKIFGVASEREMAEKLARVSVPVCPIGDRQ